MAVLSQSQMLDWLDLLGKTRKEQRAVVVDLLRHAGTDRMSADDRTTCRKALKYLETMAVLGGEWG